MPSWDQQGCVYPYLYKFGQIIEVGVYILVSKAHNQEANRNFLEDVRSG